MMVLRQLIHGLKTERVRGRLDRPVRGLAYEAEGVVRDGVFFAVDPPDGQGEARVIEAVNRGATAVISERAGHLPPRTASIRVRNCREALALAASTFYGRPSERVRVLAVRDLDGLGGVAFLSHRLLRLLGEPTGLIGTEQHIVGEREFTPRLAGEEPLDVQRMLAGMARAGERLCVIELEERRLAPDRLAGLTFERWIEVGADAAGFPGAREPHGTPTPDERRTRPVEPPIEIRFASGPTWRFRTRSARAPLSQAFEVDAFERTLSGSACRVTDAGGTTRFHCPLVGERNLLRALLAMAVVRALDADPQRVVPAARRLPDVPGRLESVRAAQPFGVLVDGAAGPVELGAVLREVRGLGARRVLLLTAGEGDRTPAEWEALGRVAAWGADWTVVSSSNARLERPEIPARAVWHSACAAGAKRVEIELNRATAIALLLGMAEPGDAVVLAGKGRRTVDERDHCVIPFDDREHARRVLASLGWAGKPPGAGRRSNGS